MSSLSGMAHFAHLIWPTWVVVLCIISPLLVCRVLRDIDSRSRGGGNVGIAVAIPKGWGKGGKTVSSFFHAFHRLSFPRLVFVRLIVFHLALFGPFQRSSETK